MSIPDVKLDDKVQIPQVGLGLWKMKDKDECKAAVQAALEIGYRHFDTAQVYGNEAYLGEALQENGIKREGVFITTKIAVKHFRPKTVLSSFDDSLKNLQTDYVDLLLLHFPVTLLRKGAWKKLEEIHASGRARTIGVSNYTIRHLQELLDKSAIKPVVNQVELHVFLQQPELVEYCREQGIAIEAYSPLAHGQGMDDATLQAIAKKHSKSAAQVMLRWCVEQGFVILPKSTHRGRIQENFDVFDFGLDDDDKAQLKSLDKDLRTCWDPTHVP